MTQERNARLLQAYRVAIAAGQDGIADALEDVILEEMRWAGSSPIVIEKGRTTTEPPWNVTCDPGVTLLGEKLDMGANGATDGFRPLWCTNKPMTVDTVDAVRNREDGE